MSTEMGWNENDLRILEDALDFHGQLSDRIIDDLADTLRRTPKAIKSKARQIKARMRKGTGLGDTVSAVPQSPSTKVGETAPENGQAPVFQTKSDPETSRENIAPTASTAARGRGAKPYTDLIKSLEELAALCMDAKKARTRAESAAKAVTEAESRLKAKQVELQKAFPAAKGLVELTLEKHS